MPENDLHRSYDHYGRIIKAMRPGLLITINNSGGANGKGSGELRVEDTISEGEILLSGRGNAEYILREEGDDCPMLVRLKSGVRGASARVVETIEVIGIDG